MHTGTHPQQNTSSNTGSPCMCAPSIAASKRPSRQTCLHASLGIPHCNTLQQYSSTHCNTLQHTDIAIDCSQLMSALLARLALYHTLQHTATHIVILKVQVASAPHVRLACTPRPVSRTATQFNVPQHTATHCNTLQHILLYLDCSQQVPLMSDLLARLARYRALQHTATNCNTLQHTATHCNTMQHTAAHCMTLQHTATHYITLQHTVTRKCAASRRPSRSVCDITHSCV